MKKIWVVFVLAAGVYACTPKASPTASGSSTIKLSKEAAAGQEVYNAKCGKCHDLPKPEAFTEAQWVPIMDKMAPKARLTETEKANVLVYVKFLSKPA